MGRICRGEGDAGLNILVRGEAVYDGLGSPPQKMDILIKDGLIADMVPHLDAPRLDGDFSSATVIEGKVVCPGFIDIHRHGDSAVFAGPDFGETELLQGITTAVMGNCGLAPVPAARPWRQEYHRYLEPAIGPVPEELSLENFHQYRHGLEGLALPINIGFLAASGAIKTAVKGFTKTPFTTEEMAAARAFIHEAFDAGALGLSFGLFYAPENCSRPEELAAIAREAAGKILCIHIRGEGDSLLESVDEAIGLAERAALTDQAALPVNISHFKATGINNWQRLIYRAIERIEAARNRGLEITADFYPYDGSSTTILSLIPPVVQGDSVQAMFSSLQTQAGRNALRRELGKRHAGWDNMVLSIGWERIIISSVTLPEHTSYCGRSMEAIAREEGFEDPAAFLAELTAREKGRVGIIALSMNRHDIDSIARLPWTCLISDSLYSRAANPHPRLHGAFPKFLREYVRKRGVLSMEDAVRKMTSMPAQRMGLKNRGSLRVGNAADMVIFDPAEFTDNADYACSTARASGMQTVILNGQIAYNEKTFFRSNGRIVERL